MSNWTSAEWPSFETRLPPLGSVAALMLRTTATCATRARTSRIAAANAGSEALRVGLEMSASSWAGLGKCCSSVFSALPDWPVYWSACVSLLVPTAPPMTTDAMTKTSQPASTDFLCRALQLPTRAAIPRLSPARNIVMSSFERSEDRDGAPVLWREPRRRAAPARWCGQVDGGWPPRRCAWGYPHRVRPGDPRPDSGLLHRARALIPPGFGELHVLPSRILEQTMNTVDDITRRSSRRELAHRRNCGIDVRLMWDPAGDDLTVEVHDGDAGRARRARRRAAAARRLPPPVRLRRGMSTLAEKGVASRIAGNAGYGTMIPWPCAC